MFINTDNDLYNTNLQRNELNPFSLASRCNDLCLQGTTGLFHMNEETEGLKSILKHQVSVFDEEFEFT